jgi:hypothetical protein
MSLCTRAPLGQQGTSHARRCVDSSRVTPRRVWAYGYDVSSGVEFVKNNAFKFDTEAPRSEGGGAASFAWRPAFTASARDDRGGLRPGRGKSLRSRRTEEVGGKRRLRVCFRSRARAASVRGDVGGGFV